MSLRNIIWKLTRSTDEEEEKVVSTKVPDGFAVLNLIEKLHGSVIVDVSGTRLKLWPKNRSVNFIAVKQNAGS